MPGTRAKLILIFAGAMVAATERHVGAQVEALLADADKYYDADDFRRAASYYDRAISTAPTQVEPAAYAKRATIFVTEKKYAAGLAWIEATAEKIHPGHPLILEQKAVILNMLPGERERSVRMAEEVVAKKPDSFSSQLIVAEYTFHAGAASAAKAASAYEAYLTHRPSEFAAGDGLFRVKLGISYLHLREHKKAEDQFNTALAKPGKNSSVEPNARKGLCAVYVAIEDFSRAVTVCERVVRERKGLKGDASPYYNLGQAYQKLSRYADALGAANSYVREKPNDPRGYLLRGKVYLRQRRFNEAESQLNEAQKRDPSGTNIEILKTFGELYLLEKRRDKAIEKLSRVLEVTPDAPDVLVQAVEAHRALGQATKAIGLGERVVRLRPDSPAHLKPVAAAYYDAGELDQARTLYQKALMKSKELGGADREAMAGLQDTMVRQAFSKFQAGDLTAAEHTLIEAYTVDPESLIVNFNLGLLALEGRKYAEAVRYLSVRLSRSPEDLLANRLIAKAYFLQGNQQKAREHYARAAEEAKKLRNHRVLAEVFIEWTPLRLDEGQGKERNIDSLVDDLEVAVQYATGQAFEDAARRNLQLVRFRRGLERLRAGNRQEALADLDAAFKNPTLLTDAERDAFHFALGMGYLSAGEPTKALPIFQQFARSAGLPFLRPPFDRIGAELFVGYCWYREGSVASRLKAAATFERLLATSSFPPDGTLRTRLQHLVRSSWEFAAYDHYGAGRTRDAEVALKKAAVLAQGTEKRTIEHNQAVLALGPKGTGNPALAEVFERMGDLPEALINLGILADQKGDAKSAFTYWMRARAKGTKLPRLDEWIEAKRRMFGFGDQP